MLCFQTELPRSAPSSDLCCSQISSFFFPPFFFSPVFSPVFSRGFEVLAEAATSQSLPGRMEAWAGEGWLGADPDGHLEFRGRGAGVWCSTSHRPRDVHIAVGPSEISSSLCSIISRRMEYLCFSFFTSRSSSSSSFWMKLLRMGISNLMYWATS